MYNERFLRDMHRELESVAFNWSDAPLRELKLLTVSENATFKATYEDDCSIILRVNRAFYHTLEELHSEFNWVNAITLSDCNIKSPKVLSTHNGDYLVPIKLRSENEFLELHAVAMEFCDGSEPKVGKDLIAWFEKLGKITAEMHTHSIAWSRPDGFVRKVWNLKTMVGKDGYWGDWREAADLSFTDIEVISAALKIANSRLKKYHNSDRYGLIHADLRLSNLLINESDMIVIDYDDCGFCWYMYDFAAAISFYELDENVPELQAAWLKGYSAVKAVSQDDINEMQTFIFLRRVLLLAWLTSHSDTPTAEEFTKGFVEGTKFLAENYIKTFSNEALKYAC